MSLLYNFSNTSTSHISACQIVSLDSQPGLPLQKLEDRHRFHEAVDEARRNAVDAGSMDEVTEGRENFFLSKNIINGLQVMMENDDIKK